MRRAGLLLLAVIALAACSSSSGGSAQSPTEGTSGGCGVSAHGCQTDTSQAPQPFGLADGLPVPVPFDTGMQTWTVSNIQTMPGQVVDSRQRYDLKFQATIVQDDGQGQYDAGWIHFRYSDGEAFTGYRGTVGSDGQWFDCGHSSFSPSNCGTGSLQAGQSAIYTYDFYDYDTPIASGTVTLEVQQSQIEASWTVS